MTASNPTDLAGTLLGGPKLTAGSAGVFADIEAERKADFGRVLEPAGSRPCRQAGRTSPAASQVLNPFTE